MNIPEPIIQGLTELFAAQNPTPQTTDITVATWCGKTLGLLVAKVHLPNNDKSQATITHAWFEAQLETTGDIQIDELDKIAVWRGGAGKFLSLYEIITARIAEEYHA